MSTGPDGDDDPPIEIEPEATGPSADPPDDGSGPGPARSGGDGSWDPTHALISGGTSVGDAQGGEGAASAMPPPLPADPEELIDEPPPLEQAASGGWADDVALFAGEAAAHPDADRRAVLLAEISRLQEDVASDRAAALTAARGSFSADPSFLAALWTLRRLLAAESRWEELAAVYADALGAAPLSPPERADLLVERGRLLEDRLDRPADAAASYREALGAERDHVAALLSLFLLGARTGEGAAVVTALAGLARRADTPARRVALTAARAASEPGADPAGAARALGTVEEALAALDDGTPLVPLLRELDALARGPAPPEVAGRALDHLAARVAASDPALAAALLRERARLAEDDPELALQALEEAARLAPAHPLVAAALIEAGARLDRPDVSSDAVVRYASAAPADGAGITDLVMRQAEALARAGRPGDALAALDAAAAVRGEPARPGAHGGLESGAEIGALRAVLLARARDAVGLAAAFEADGAQARGRAAAWALAFAAAVRQHLGGDLAGAEVLWRRALAVSPGYRPALDALEALLRASGRISELAALLEGALGALGPEDAAREAWLRGELVAVYRDDLGLAEPALVHQRRLCALAPDDVDRRVRLRDLELAPGRPDAEDAETVLALAAGAAEPAVAAALKVEGARLLAATGGDAERARAEALLREAITEDVTGLASGALERVLPDAAAQAQALGDELASMAGSAPGDVVRALRFRLAHHQLAAGWYAEAIATLTPLRSEGDPLARAWSWDLARQSGDAILEVAVLSEVAGVAGEAGGEPGDVLVALGEALERAGDPSGAAEAFRRAVAAAGSGVPSGDAAVGLVRLAAAARAPSPTAPLEALRAVAAACPDQPRFAEAALREAALLRLATGRAEDEDLAAVAQSEATATERTQVALRRWSAGVRRGDAGAVAEALLEMAVELGATGTLSTEAGALLARAAARARLAGPSVAESVHTRAWQAARPAALVPGLSDLPVEPGGAWPSERPDLRRARAAGVPGPLGLALDLDAALDAERRGALGAALAGYARAISVAPERLEAWEGVRRVARAGSDGVGEARALTRLGALVKTPAHAARLFSEGARLYEQVGHWDEAMALWAKALEARPDDEPAFTRLRALLGEIEGTPDGAAALERLLSHRLVSVPLTAEARVALLVERARHRLTRLADRGGAIQDFKRILNIDPQHLDSLWELGHLAADAGEYGAAARFYERLLGIPGDEERAAAARLELALCYEATQERARAIDVLRRAAAARPDDPLPQQELVELHLRLGDWRSAIETLRDWETHVPDVPARSALHLRIGELLRDHGRDATGAALSFRTAAELDPLGDGMRALVALHETQGDPAGARQTLEREIAQLRAALAEEPLDAARLARLAEFLEALGNRPPRDPHLSEALAAVAGAREVAGGGVARAPAPPRALAPGNAGTFWAALAYPGALGFMAEIWPLVVEAALALHPPPPGARPPHEARLVAGAEPRLGWVEASAVASGLGGVRLYLAAAGAPPALVVPVLEPEPALVFGPAVLHGGPEVQFRIGRALGLLRDRATVLEWVTAEDLAPLFACAAVVAGAPPAAGLPAPPEAMLKAVTRAMSRKDRKALALQASRFGFEALDPARWQRAVLRTADRLGLLLAGDVAAAVAALAASDAPATGVRPDPARRDDLLRFALADAYPLLRHEGGLAS
jgi:cellulose synthase operon protein C